MTAPRRAALWTGTAVLVATLPVALLIAPPDRVQGEAQRLMYLHVPVAWSAYLCFFVVLAASVWHLHRRHESARHAARAAAEVGVGLTVLTLATGSLWGALTWGTWWAWDARVITTAAMGLVYVVYLAVGQLVGSGGGRLAHSLLGVGGFLTVPLVHFSVLWWRTLHQPPTILAPSLDPPIESLMLVTLASAVIGTTLLTIWAISSRAYVLDRRAFHTHRSAAGTPGSQHAVEESDRTTAVGR